MIFQQTVTIRGKKIAIAIHISKYIFGFAHSSLIIMPFHVALHFRNHALCLSSFTFSNGLHYEKLRFLKEKGLNSSAEYFILTGW